MRPILPKPGLRASAAPIKRVDKLLASAGLTMDAVMAQALSLKLDDIERIDRMIATAEGRRNAILREVDRHRTSMEAEPPSGCAANRGGRDQGHRRPTRFNANHGMSSAGKINANRANARASRGPKTAQGRARSARNARRHGLSLPVLSDRALSDEVEALACEIAGTGATSMSWRAELPKHRLICAAYGLRATTSSRAHCVIPTRCSGSQMEKVQSRSRGY
jgi:hypothetical protein